LRNYGNISSKQTFPDEILFLSRI
jgi:hypothetical protein